MQPLLQPNLARKRHQCLFEDDLPLDQCGSIKSVPDLRRHLQTAIEVEHSTILPYLCALYSIKDGSNQFAYKIIQSVIMEEMLHMILACNILNAIDGRPAINTRHFVPNYPTYLPHSDKAFLVPLQKFSQEAIGVFLKIEQPAAHHAPAQADNWTTLGQFYQAVKHALCHFNHVAAGGIFTGKPERQISTEHYYGGGGKLLAVHNLADALLGINEIIGQGEGMNGSIIDPDHIMFGEDIEYAHYYKYNEIMQEQRYLPTDKPQDSPSGPKVDVEWHAAWDMKESPKMADYPTGSPLWVKTYEFNKTYMALLDGIHKACNGQPEVLKTAIPLMYDLKYKAQELMQMPIEAGPNQGKMAGPSFEFVK